jgi:hypothetical protein
MIDNKKFQIGDMISWKNIHSDGNIKKTIYGIVTQVFKLENGRQRIFFARNDQMNDQFWVIVPMQKLNIISKIK